MNHPATPAEWTRAAGALLGTMRTRVPLVHCLTNHVVTNFTANVLLAAGAAPAMIHDPEESAIFAGVASALLVNVGTIEREQAEAMRRAVAAANAAGRPWVLDPVAVGALPLRTQVAAERYRWLVEEYRVAVFAQALGTAEPASRPRLDRLWAKVVG